jgi:hypothetical protein
MASQARYCRRARTLPADITDDGRPRAVAHLEHVVEVATKIVPIAGRSISGADVHAGNRWQRRRKQRRLKRVGNAAAIFEETRVLDGESSPPRQLFCQDEIVNVVATARDTSAQPQRAEHLIAHREGSDDQRAKTRTLGLVQLAAQLRGARADADRNHPRRRQRWGLGLNDDRRDAPNRTIGIMQVDRAPVRKERDDEMCQPLERVFPLE